MPIPTTYERFLKHVNDEANAQQIEILIDTSTREDLQALARDLLARLRGADFAARINHDTIMGQQR